MSDREKYEELIDLSNKYHSETILYLYDNKLTENHKEILKSDIAWMRDVLENWE